MIPTMAGYHGFEAKWHDLFWEAEEAPDEGLLLDEFLSQVPGPSLYLGSGSGRLLGPLSALGHQVTGLEISPEMVAFSREKFPEAPVEEGAWQEHEGEYSSILIPAFTFQLFEDPQRQLKKMREQGERLYLTLFFPWAELSGELPENRWYLDREIELPGGEVGVLETRHRIREESGSLVRRHRYSLKDATGKVVRREETVQRLRFFTDVALRKMLSEAGWRIDKEIVNLGEDEDDDDLVYVATFWLSATT
jgi:SAM-dependent methyltransferase